jgi:hypothetical protein
LPRLLLPLPLPLLHRPRVLQRVHRLRLRLLRLLLRAHRLLLLLLLPLLLLLLLLPTDARRGLTRVKPHFNLTLTFLPPAYCMGNVYFWAVVCRHYVRAIF